MDEAPGGTVAVAQDQLVEVQAPAGDTASERFWEPIRGRLISFRNLSVPLRALLAVLLALAFLWDLLTSGEQVTNRESANFPRTARVLLYLGYTLLVTCSVLYFSSLFFRSGVPDTSYASDFNPDCWAQQWLVLLGSPLLLTGFLLGGAAARQQKRAAGAGL